MFWVCCLLLGYCYWLNITCWELKIFENYLNSNEDQSSSSLINGGSKTIILLLGWAFEDTQGSFLFIYILIIFVIWKVNLK